VQRAIAPAYTPALKPEQSPCTEKPKTRERGGVCSWFRAPGAWEWRFCTLRWQIREQQWLERAGDTELWWQRLQQKPRGETTERTDMHMQIWATVFSEMEKPARMRPGESRGTAREVQVPSRSSPEKELSLGTSCERPKGSSRGRLAPPVPWLLLTSRAALSQKFH